MIISHKHKFIFIKTLKTASTSLEIALSKYCDHDDILTPLIEIDENIRKEKGYQCATNYHLKLHQWKLRDYKYFIQKRKAPKFGKHASAKYIRSRVSSKIWNYYKFCFDRNPWDKAISLYYWQTRNLKRRPPIELYLENILKMRLTNFGKYSKNNQIIVDDVFKYEKLPESLEIIYDKIGIDLSGSLIKTKNTMREKNSDYRSLLSTKQRELIEKTCSKEINFLKYQFNS